IFNIRPGAQYMFGAVEMELDAAGEGVTLPSRADLRAQPGQAALTASVIEDQDRIEKWLEDNHCLFSHETRHQAVLDHTQRQVHITYHVMAGPVATVGPIKFTGQETIAAEYLRKGMTLQAGECFKRSKVNEAQVKMQRSHLLSSAKAVVPDAPNADGSVPLTFMVTESKPRSIKAGLNYSTDIGPGFSAGWEHRNFFSAGEKVSAELSVTPIEQMLSTAFEKPYFLRDDQTLKLKAIIKQEDSDAYRTSGLTLSGDVDRKLGNGWTAGAGASYGFERIKDQNSTEDVALLSFPVFASQDKRNDTLEPTEGWTLDIKTAPAFDTLGFNSNYVKSSVAGTYYYAIPVASEPVIALRAASGGITGSSTDDIPASKRFYSGGGGSVRGYGYQLAGPLDSENDPLGGRSFLEFSTELRFRFAEDYGFVTFLDGGSAFNSAYPDFEEDLLFGAGIGFRYYTGFGPIRADIAIPLDRREGIDDAFQLYFSIGQAF
ncbi:MAG: autotransporter assembly complex family protein, partial [Alphaproteobacteria bacterium]